MSTIFISTHCLTLSYLVGMGKTIMLSALIQTSPPCDPQTEEAAQSTNKSHQLKLDNAFRPAPQRKSSKPPSATLIVAPASLLSQWFEEIQRSSKPGTVRALIWHGQNRLDLEAAIEDCSDVDQSIKVIVTSYGVLASEHAKSERSKSLVYDSKSEKLWVYFG